VDEGKFQNDFEMPLKIKKVETKFKEMFIEMKNKIKEMETSTKETKIKLEVMETNAKETKIKLEVMETNLEEMKRLFIHSLTNITNLDKEFQYFKGICKTQTNFLDPKIILDSLKYFEDKNWQELSKTIKIEENYQYLKEAFDALEVHYPKNASIDEKKKFILKTYGDTPEFFIFVNKKFKNKLDTGNIKTMDDVFEYLEK
jgi:hypothetical protein